MILQELIIIINKLHTLNFPNPQEFQKIPPILYLLCIWEMLHQQNFALEIIAPHLSCEILRFLE